MARRQRCGAAGERRGGGCQKMLSPAAPGLDGPTSAGQRFFHSLPSAPSHAAAVCSLPLSYLPGSQRCIRCRYTSLPRSQRGTRYRYRAFPNRRAAFIAAIHPFPDRSTALVAAIVCADGAFLGSVASSVAAGLFPVIANIVHPSPFPIPRGNKKRAPLSPEIDCLRLNMFSYESLPLVGNLNEGQQVPTAR